MIARATVETEAFGLTRNRMRLHRRRHTFNTQHRTHTMGRYCNL